MRLVTLALLLSAVACGSTEPIDPATVTVVGSYAFTGRALPPGTPTGFTPGGTVRNVISDDYVLTASGTWTREYRGTAQPTGGTVAPDNASTSGTYVRSGTQIVFSLDGSQQAFNQYIGTVTADGLEVTESPYIMHYGRR